MPKMTILEDKTLPLILQIDIADYFQSYLSFNQNRDSIALEEKFNQDKSLLTSLLEGFNGELLWIVIKKELAARIKNYPKETELANMLVEKEESKLPIAIRALNGSFIELLKNTIDASLKNSLSHGETKKLEMSINIQLMDDQIIFTLSDNAGGFSEDYLNGFDEYVAQKGYKNQRRLSNKFLSDKELYLGGAGKGLAIFLNYLLDGEMLVNDGKSEKVLNVKAQSFIKIQNKQQELDMGMEMIISSPIKPYEERARSLPKPMNNSSPKWEQNKHPVIPTLDFFKKNKKLEKSSDSKSIGSEPSPF